MNALTRQPDIQ